MVRVLLEAKQTHTLPFNRKEVLGKVVRETMYD
jgi:hypothetical protein